MVCFTFPYEFSDEHSHFLFVKDGLIVKCDVYRLDALNNLVGQSMWIFLYLSRFIYEILAITLYKEIKINLGKFSLLHLGVLIHMSYAITNLFQLFLLVQLLFLTFLLEQINLVEEYSVSMDKLPK